MTGRRGGHVLIARCDNAGDVLLAGPAIRAAAAGADRVTVLCGPAGAEAARLLPGIDEVMVWETPWVGYDPPPVRAPEIDALLAALASRRIDRAAVLCSFHQSPLPLALLLRLAGVGEIAAVCEDHPGALLDHRIARTGDRHEVETNLTVLAALGYALPDGDDGRLRVRVRPPATGSARRSPAVVVHPTASVPARAIPPGMVDPLVERLVGDGWDVTVTGGPGDPHPSPRPGLTDLVGGTSLGGLAAVIGRAAAFVGGNSGPAHLAAAVGTPVVSVFAPVVPWELWRPWRVPSVQLGRLDQPCAGCRARTCPLPGQPCLGDVTPAAVSAAVRALAGRPGHRLRHHRHTDSGATP